MSRCRGKYSDMRDCPDLSIRGLNEVLAPGFTLRRLLEGDLTSKELSSDEKVQAAVSKTKQGKADKAWELRKLEKARQKELAKKKEAEKAHKKMEEAKKKREEEAKKKAADAEAAKNKAEGEAEAEAEEEKKDEQMKDSEAETKSRAEEFAAYAKAKEALVDDDDGAEDLSYGLKQVSLLQVATGSQITTKATPSASDDTPPQKQTTSTPSVEALKSEEKALRAKLAKIQAQIAKQTGESDSEEAGMYENLEEVD